MEELKFGMLVNCNLRDALLRIDHLLASNYYCVLRGIDSSRSVSDLVKILNFHNIEHEVTSGNVCLSLSTLRKVLSKGLFCGFDEVWIIEGMKPSIELYSLASATSDASDFSSQLPTGFGNAMEHLSCVLAMGDGLGLNYATYLPEIHNTLLEMQE